MLLFYITRHITLSYVFQRTSAPSSGSIAFNSSIFFVIKPTRCTNFSNYFVMKLYMFGTFRLSIIRSLFTVHSAMAYVIPICRQLSSRTVLVLLESCLQTCMTYTIAECTVNKLLMVDRGTVLNM